MNQNPHHFMKPQPDSAEGYGGLEKLQGKEKESHARGLQVGKNCPADPKEQEPKESTREHLPWESGRANGETLSLQRDGSGLPTGGVCPVTTHSSRPSSDLFHPGFSNRADPSQEWKVVKVKRVLISPVGEPRKANFLICCEKVTKGVGITTRPVAAAAKAGTPDPGGAAATASRQTQTALLGEKHGRGAGAERRRLGRGKEPGACGGGVEDLRPPAKGCEDISRSASLSEKELKEAKARSQRIAAQLTTPPSSNSKGVLLFHRRKQRVNAFTLEAPKTTSREQVAVEEEDNPRANAHHSIPSHGKEFHLKQTLREKREPKGSSCPKDSGLWKQSSTMEKYEERLVVEQTLDNTQGSQWNKVNSEKNTPLSSEEIPAEDFQQIPLSVYLKASTGTASTNGMHELTSHEFEKAPLIEQAPAIDRLENISPIVDDAPVTDRENNSTILEKEPYMLHIDRENNVLDKEPYLPIIGSENNNNIPDKEPYMPMIDRENNIVLDKALSEPVSEGKENGELLSKEQDVLIIDNENIFPSAETEKPILVTEIQPNEIPAPTNKQYCEVRLTLSKPMPVKNRTARPFGTQSLASPPTPAAEKSPVVELPPPPTYAETFSSPPPVTRVRSPPAYSALYPNEEEKAPVPQGAKYEDSRPGPQSGENKEPPPNKSGILEESAARRATKKFMFTFVEKPKVAPNPDLLNLVQRADNRKKQKGHGGAIAEEEPFALGAEASNFLPESSSMEGAAQAPGDTAPEWSSCLRSPKIQPKPMIKSNQSLSEARGKGAELFARRQSRMQKYVIESPSHPDITRSPSPTMSLPPSWKYASETHLSPMAFHPTPRSPARSQKAPPVPLYNSNMSESEISKKELEISKQQPYQLQSSLFILSPVKGPLRSLPKGAPPPKPVIPEPSYTRQASCPTSPLPPPPILYPPAQPSPSRSMPGLFAPSAGTVHPSQNSRASTETAPEPSFEYSSRILSPRAKGVFQAPRPSYSTKSAGIEPQERKASLPASPTWTPRQLRRQPSSLDGWLSPAPTPEPEEGLIEAFRATSVMSPQPPMSPSWSERSLSPFRQEMDPKSSRQMQALLARNIINAARRKSTSPKATGVECFRPFTPPADVSSSSSSPKNHSPSPLQSPRPMRMDGYRRVSLPTSMASPQASASSSNSPRLLGSPSPTYRSPLQSPKALRMNGNKYFTLPINAGGSFFSAATNNGPRTMGTHSVAHRDPALSPKPTIMDSHRIFTPLASTSRKSSCVSPKNLGSCSPTLKSPLQSPIVRAHSPVKRNTSMSPTNSDVSLDSEDSGIKSPSIRSLNICPRGWNGNLRLKRGSLPTGAPCTS
ncbi:synaptopodin [Elgaria multicarinata webbii]|uniref:synaptopodin n=1 Tax=Elgaria multicarinata webbii TaxID=159646 RepID=UPI002FCCC9E8